VSQLDPTAVWERIQQHIERIDWLVVLEQWGLRLGAALLLLVAGLWLARILSAALERALARANVDPMLRSFLRNIAYFAGVIVVGVAALTQLGVPPASLIAVLGAAGLAIGLALKDSLANFASGVMLILLRPFRAGDFVQIAGLEGEIEQVRVFQTQMRTIDNRVIVLPNSQITTAPIINFTARPRRRIDLTVGIDYDDDLQQAKALLLSVAAANPRVLSDPASDVLVSALAESSVNLVLRVWVSTPDVLAAKSELLEAIHIELRRNGMSIPFPQRDLNVYHHGGESLSAEARKKAIDAAD
jgi:small-conductance mechanosensitive channel